ncbi:MAG: hypothetical protein HOB26_02725 [Flavobacteriales bacterium]|jgi:hypothetical protein|nr:hypothetical protein [Flavobacteriales bacterium]
MLPKRTINQLLLIGELKNVKQVTKNNLSSYKGFEKTDEEEAEEIITSLETICEVILNQAKRDAL